LRIYCQYRRKVVFMPAEIKLLNGISVTVEPSGKATGKCRYCGADILWCITPKGRRMPVSRDKEGYYVCHLAVCRERKK